MLDPSLFLLAASMLEPQALRDDFQLFRQTLESTHPGLYRYTPKREMDAQFDAAAKKLDRPMTPLEFRLLLTPVLTAMKCGHTRLGDDAAVKEVLDNAPLFPFQLFEDGQRFYILENRSTDQSVKPGAELLAINGHAMELIEKLMLPQLGGDGDIETGKRQRLTRTFPALLRVIFGPAEAYELKLKDRTVKVAGVKRADFAKNTEANPVNIKHTDWWKENVSLRFLRDPDVAQLRIGGFGGADYPAQLEATFAKLREKNTQALILDLRGNGGGDDNYGALLVSYLGAEPFRYFDRIQMVTITPPSENTNFPASQLARLKGATKSNPDGGYLVLPAIHQGLNEQQPGKSYFKGKVIVLIDGGCFSTCADVAAVTHHLKRAVFVGEETGGGYYGNNSGSSITLTLPNSKIPVSIPMWEYWNAVPGYPHKRRGTIPEHAVTVKITDVLAGRDEVLEAATAMVK